MDALPVGQWSGEVADAEGTVRYLSKMLAHGLKAEQRPPIGWRGHRTSQTHGYLVRPASVMRVEAREALREKRRLWRAEHLAESGDVEAVYDQLTAEARDASWRLLKAPRSNRNILAGDALPGPEYVSGARWKDTGRVVGSSAALSTFLDRGTR